MFRVLDDTGLRRVAATTLLVFASALAACGGDDPATATTAAATTPSLASGGAPAATTGEVKPAIDVPDQAPDNPPPANDDAGSSVSPGETGSTDEMAAAEREASENAAAAAAVPAGAVKVKIDAVEAALEKAGFKPQRSPVSGGSAGALQVDNISVVFFPNTEEAKEAAAKLGKVFDINPKMGRLATRGSRVYILTAAPRMTQSDRDDFEKIQRVANDAL